MIYLLLHLIVHFAFYWVIWLTVTWLFLRFPVYKFTRFFIHFIFFSDEGPTLEKLDLFAYFSCDVACTKSTLQKTVCSKTHQGVSINTHLSKKHISKRAKSVIQHTLRCVKFWTKKVC